MDTTTRSQINNITPIWGKGEVIYYINNDKYKTTQNAWKKIMHNKQIK